MGKDKNEKKKITKIHTDGPDVMIAIMLDTFVCNPDMGSLI